MENAIIKAYIHAPIERVWDIISDHEGYQEVFRVMTSCKLIKEGVDDRNGVGAVREILAGRVRFVEEILVFEAPNKIEYKIIECSLPFEHKLGRIDLIDRGEGTELHWVSTFRLKVPLIGGLLSRLARMATQDVFYKDLFRLKKKLEAEQI